MDQQASACFSTDWLQPLAALAKVEPAEAG
jgi:hypothetical protein